MPGLLPDIDPDGLLEFSVVYTDRALNHMSKRFAGVMQDILTTLQEVYHAHTAVLVPGSGTFGMEAVARQFANREKVLIVRNGWFSYRWTQIFEEGGLGGGAVVCKARRQGPGSQDPWAPCAAEDVAAAIRTEKPKVVFAPHVETASGILLSDSYLRTVADAAHEVGALFVLDCVASGAMWVDMEKTGVDVLISAPQRAGAARRAAPWSCSRNVRAKPSSTRKAPASPATSRSGCRSPRATKRPARLPHHHAHRRPGPPARRDAGDACLRLRQGARRADRPGRQGARPAGVARLSQRGGRRLEGPGVVVSYTTDPGIQSGKKFMEAGLQTASGVPLQCDEGPDFKTFRIGLFGLEKWHNVDRTVGHIAKALDDIGVPAKA